MYRNTLFVLYIILFRYILENVNIINLNSNTIKIDFCFNDDIEGKCVCEKRKIFQKSKYIHHICNFHIYIWVLF